jgi:hypothetical protein
MGVLLICLHRNRHHFFGRLPAVETILYFELFWATSGLFFDNDTTFNRPTICSNLTSPYKRKTPERILTQPNNQRKKFHSM